MTTHGHDAAPVGFVAISILPKTIHCLRYRLAVPTCTVCTRSLLQSCSAADARNVLISKITGLVPSIPVEEAMFGDCDDLLKDWR